MSRSKHQTLKSIMDGQSARQFEAMFAEGDHDAMEFLIKGALKKSTKRARRDAAGSSSEAAD